MRPVTPSNRPESSPILTGHFREWKGYAAYRPRGTDDWLLIYTLKGRGRFGHGNGDLIAVPGDAVLLRPGSLHDYGVERTLEHWELLWAHFVPRPLWLPWLNWPLEAPGLARIRLSDPAARRHLAKRLADVHRLATSGGRLGTELALNALEEVLLLCAAQGPAEGAGRRDPRLEAAVEFLCSGLARRVTVEDVARAARLSASRLAHLFKQQMGMSPLQYLDIQRLNRARQLLEYSPLSIKQIAFEVGFASPFYFSLRFKRLTGRNPRAYRDERTRRS